MTPAILALLAGALLDGGQLSSTELSGHVAVLGSWGSWCGSCRRRDPGVPGGPGRRPRRGRARPRFGRRGDRRAVRHGLRRPLRHRVPVAPRPARELAPAFRGCPAHAIPSTIVLDPEERVAAVSTGTVSNDDLRSVLDRMLGEG